VACSDRRNHRVFAVFDRAETWRHGTRKPTCSTNPTKHLLRTNLKDQPTVRLRGNIEVTDVARTPAGSRWTSPTGTGEPESVLATYVLGCDGANSVVERQSAQRWRTSSSSSAGW
jgi:3-(3-hydroxy-phenyl)propionate hydroxylase